MKGARRFRLSVVRYSVVFTALLGMVAYYFNSTVGLGILIGGVAATLGFWIFAWKMEKLASQPKDNVQSYVLRWSGVRYILFGAALYRGYTLDPDSMGGLLGAVGGIFIIRFVTIFFGVTGLDLKEE